MGEVDKGHDCDRVYLSLCLNVMLYLFYKDLSVVDIA